VTISFQQCLPPLPVPELNTRHSTRYVVLAVIVIFQRIVGLPNVQPIHGVIVEFGTILGFSVHVVGDKGHENVFPIPQGAFSVMKDDIVPHQVSVLEKGATNVSFHHHQLGQNDLGGFVTVLGTVTIERVSGRQISTKLSDDAFGVAVKFDNHLVESLCGEFHVIVKMQDPFIFGKLTKVKTETQTHLVVVFNGINVLYFWMHKLKGCFGVGMQQKNFVNVGMRQKSPHHG